jgi:hypothetical protein
MPAIVKPSAGVVKCNCDRAPQGIRFQKCSATKPGRSAQRFHCPNGRGLHHGFGHCWNLGIERLSTLRKSTFLRLGLAWGLLLGRRRGTNGLSVTITYFCACSATISWQSQHSSTERRHQTLSGNFASRSEHPQSGRMRRQRTASGVVRLRVTDALVVVFRTSATSKPIPSDRSGSAATTRG